MFYFFETVGGTLIPETTAAANITAHMTKNKFKALSTDQLEKYAQLYLPVIGEIKPGLPEFKIPQPFSRSESPLVGAWLATPVILVILLGFMESISISKKYAEILNYPLNSNQVSLLLLIILINIINIIIIIINYNSYSSKSSNGNNNSSSNNENGNSNSSSNNESSNNSKSSNSNSSNEISSISNSNNKSSSSSNSNNESSSSSSINSNSCNNSLVIIVIIVKIIFFYKKKKKNLNIKIFN